MHNVGKFSLQDISNENTEKSTKFLENSGKLCTVCSLHQKVIFCEIYFRLETRLGGGSKMHKQEELGQISDAAGEGNQNIEGEPELLGLLQENTCGNIAIPN